MKRILMGVLLVLGIGFAPAWAGDNETAKQVIEDWFAAMKAGDMDKAGSYLSPQFVSIHTDGIVRNKDQELTLIKNLHMKSYSLSDFKYSNSGDTIIVTYKDTGEEKIDNKKIGAGAKGRMAVVQKQGNSWLIIGYANMDTIG
jgi:ketosteroid isomerase-like protein